MIPLLSLVLRQEYDVVNARQRTRQIARLLGFTALEQTGLTTAVSEIARNAQRYAGSGRIDFLIDDDGTRQVSLAQSREPRASPLPPALIINVSDQGPGIADLPAILAGRYVSRTGMGIGIIGAKRLVDSLEIESRPGRGTTVALTRDLPRRLPGAPPIDMAALAAELAKPLDISPISEMERQNQDLLRAMEALKERQEELVSLNLELSDTNRGVMALYAELDDKAQQLQRADEMKDSFLSNMSHEFRTPLNSIIGLARLLEDRIDGELSPEQEKQVLFIRRSAEGLADLVNDLLDTAKIAAGKLDIYPQEFSAADLFSSLRGVFRPLHTSPDVTLIFENASALPPLFTDEAKVNQILRNFISNALKFTERGHVRVSGAALPGDRIKFCVEDTGIGIAPDDRPRIFAEFGQVEGALQRRTKGTGLGLPLARRLAELLGGQVDLMSEPGTGSTFSVILPCRYNASKIGDVSGESSPDRAILSLNAATKEDAIHV